MAFWNRNKQPVAEQKAAPKIDKALFYAGDVKNGEGMKDKKAYATEGYMQNAVAFACVNKIAGALGSVDLEVVKYTAKNPVPQPNHPLYDLIERPNADQGGADFFAAIATNYLIYGEAYILRLPEGTNARIKPTSLYLIRPDMMTKQVNDFGQVISYTYATANGKKVYAVDDKGNCDVLCIKSFHPVDYFNGFAAMAAAANSVDIVNSANSWNMSLLKNSACPSGAVVNESETELSEEQYSRLKEQMDSRYSGSENAGRPLLLDGGLNWKQIALSPKDMDFHENLWTAARMIATVFGVPPQLVNIPGESTYSNLAEAKESLWQETVLPLLDRVLDALNTWLAPIYGKEFYIIYNAQNIPALAEKQFNKIDKLNTAAFLTINEKRNMLGFEDVVGGDVVLADSGKVPIDILSDVPNA